MEKMETGEEPRPSELITSEVLDGIKGALDYQKKAWEKNPLNSIAVEMGQVAKTGPFVELVETAGAKLPFVKEEVLEELKTKLYLASPKVKQGIQGSGTIELYRIRKPDETDEEEERIFQEQGGLGQAMKRRLLHEASFVEVLRDGRNDKIIDIEIGYPYFRRAEHYGL